MKFLIGFRFLEMQSKASEARKNSGKNRTEPMHKWSNEWMDERTNERAKERT